MENKSLVSSARRVDREALEKRRKVAIGWYRKNKSQYWIAKHLGVSFEAVRKWVDRYEAKGMQGLESKGHPGPRAELDEQDRKKIRAAILKGPRAEGYATDLWTLERIAHLIKRIGNVSYHPVHVWKVVIALGFSCQKPERRAKERDEEAIKNWRIRSFPPVSVMGPKT